MRVGRTVSVVILLANLSLPRPAFACSCLWGGPFSRVAPAKELVLLGEVLDHYKNSMDVKVIEVLKGMEERRLIRIWGDDGALCRPYVSGFPIGSRWLLAVSPLPDQEGGQPAASREGFTSRPGKREYAISVCGDFWLEVRDERAVGRITVDEHSSVLEWVPLGEMLAWLRSGGKASTLSPTRM